MNIITTHYNYEEAFEAANRIANSIPPEALKAMQLASQANQQISEALAPIRKQYSQIQDLIDTVTSKAIENPDSIIETLTTNTFGDKEDEFNRQVIDPVINSSVASTQSTDNDDDSGKISIDIHNSFPIKPGYKETLKNPPDTTTVDDQNTEKSSQKVSQLFNNLSSFTIKASETILAAETVYHFLRWLINYLN